MDKLFYVDSSRGDRVSYSELMRHTAAMGTSPQVLAWEGAYSYFAKLLAGVRMQATMVLVDGPKKTRIGIETWEAFCGESCEPDVQVSKGRSTFQPTPVFSAPPGCPEYRGEGCEDASPGKTTQDHGKRSENLAQDRSVDWLKGGTCQIGLFTSGTTGKPKLVMHSIMSLTRGVRVSEKHQADIWGLAYHPAHIAGLQVLFQALANHNSLVRLFDLQLDQIHHAIESEGITHLSATPTFYNQLCRGDQLHPNVRSVTSGGELSHAGLRERMAKTFPNARIRNIYASTEVGTLLIGAGDHFQVPKTYEGRIKVIDGELAVHRSLLAASLQVNWPEEFYLTGDCVEVLDTSPLTIRLISRQGDWINVGGYKVNPHEVEQTLLEMDEVQEALVYGRDNSVTGSLVCCDIVLAGASSLTGKDIYARLAPLMPAYMIPRVVRCVDAIGATNTGKKERSL